MSVSHPLSESSTHSESSPARGIKRQKVTRACDNCKSRKRRCNGELPCSLCRNNGSQCTYLATYTRGRLVQPKSATSPQKSSVVSASPNDNHHSYGTPTIEVGVGPARPPSPEGNSTTVAGQYLGPTSPYTFLRRAWRRFEEDGTNSTPHHNTDEPGQAESIFQFGDAPMPSVKTDGFRLPDRATTTALATQHFDSAMPTYRFLHRDTVLSWLDTYHQMEELGPDRVTLVPSRQAVVLVVLALASLFNLDARGMLIGAGEASWGRAECFFQVARAKLRGEYGKPRLESIQARLISCLYLLHTRRPNQAWYTFGVTVQITMALGLHRAATTHALQQDFVTRECRKRAFWAISTLDTYLSVVMGRPTLLRLEDIDQQYPEPLDDEDFTAAGPSRVAAAKDPIIKATILHAQIARIVKKATEEQYSVRPKTVQQQLEIASGLNKEAAAWHASLPVVMSGAIHPSSLMPIFRRQANVLQLAHAHALMLINRSSLLLDTDEVTTRSTLVEICISAAESTLITIESPDFGLSLLETSWFTQYVVFNALSIVYVWLIQRSHHRLPISTTRHNEEHLLKLAERVQGKLTAVSQANAPSLRYNIVLEELQQETRQLSTASMPRPPHLGGLLQQHPRVAARTESLDSADAAAMLQTMSASNAPVGGGPIPDMLNVEFPFDPDLWLQLDSFPFSDFGYVE